MYKSVQEIYRDVIKARAEQKEVPKKAKLKCRVERGTWMLEDLGEVCVCFITAGPITKLCVWGEEESGGHVL